MRSRFVPFPKHRGHPGTIATALAILVLAPLSAGAQTTPTPQALPYTHNFSARPWASPSYPAGWQGWVVGALPGTTPSSYNTTGPSTDRTMSPNGDAAMNSGSAYNYNGKIGWLNS